MANEAGEAAHGGEYRHYGRLYERSIKMKMNFTNNGKSIGLEICNYFDELKGDNYMGEYTSYVDFVISFEKVNEEIEELYIQPNFNSDGKVIGFGGRDTQDDYDLLPGWINENELINDMNALIKEYEES
jgi:hypothetical protein